MKHAQERIEQANKESEPSVKVFLSTEEMKRYEAFLAPFAGKKGPYLKQLLLKKIDSKKSGGTK
jgi:hypothetical protein